MWGRFLFVDCRFSFVTILFLCILFLPICTFAKNVTLAWDPNDETNLAGYSVYGSKEYPGPPYYHIDSYSLNDLNPNNPKCKITDLQKDLSYYFIITAYDSNNNESEPSNPICVKNGKSCLPNSPVPVIKANGSNKSIKVSPTKPVRITTSLDAGDYAGQKADVWILAATQYGWWYSYTSQTGWRLGIRRFDEAPLSDMSSLTILHKSISFVGNYTFYFAIDDNADGQLDATWIDSIDVEVKK